MTWFTVLEISFIEINSS